MDRFCWSSLILTQNPNIHIIIRFSTRDRSVGSKLWETGLDSGTLKTGGAGGSGIFGKIGDSITEGGVVASSIIAGSEPSPIIGRVDASAKTGGVDASAKTGGVNASAKTGGVDASAKIGGADPSAATAGVSDLSIVSCVVASSIAVEGAMISGVIDGRSVAIGAGWAAVIGIEGGVAIGTLGLARGITRLCAEYTSSYGIFKAKALQITLSKSKDLKGFRTLATSGRPSASK